MPWLHPRKAAPDGPPAPRAFTTRLVIGRADDADLRIEDRSVSRIHCVVQQIHDGGWRIHDPGSRNGTWVNGERVQHLRALRDGDLIGIGGIAPEQTWAFHLGDPAPALPPDAPSVPSPGSGPGSEPARSATIVQSRIQLPPETRFVPQAEVGNLSVLRRDYERLRAAWEMMQRLAGETRSDRLLGQALDALLEMFGADRGAALLRDGEGQLRRAAQRAARHLKDQGGPVPEVQVSDTLLREVLEQRCAVISRDVATDERFSGARSIVAAGVRATMATPLIHAGQVLGVIVVDSTRAMVAFSDQDLEVFETAARQIAVSLHGLNLAEAVRAQEATRERFERLVSPVLAARIASGEMDVERQGQLRDVSVLFSDIRGFTQLAERQDATDIVAMLNTYFEEMVDIVFAHEGTLDKFIGDNVMAIFGAPTGQGDHAQRAVRAAIQMQQRIHALTAGETPRLRVPVRIGIGINSGEVVAGFLGSPMALDYTVIGDVVNTASRICSAAPPGAILLGEATRHALGDGWPLKARSTITAKGKRDAVGVYEVEYSASGAPTGDDQNL
ncbi:MAG: adenylate/guanylate cyclase domain-containing protein [Pseudomonadales bacterium]|jgi:adenylate cyclase|nr:adenylate/guanylate cyclase domain-containing protein [Pseudomonadales bacterium]